MSDEHTGWLSALDFYKQDLQYLKRRLTEIAGKNTGKGPAAEIEHYENQISVRTENIDTLRHDINETLAKSAAQAMQNSAGYIDAALLKEHVKQKELFLTEELIINELRQNFNHFASKWM